MRKTIKLSSTIEEYIDEIISIVPVFDKGCTVYLKFGRRIPINKSADQLNKEIKRIKGEK